MTSLLLTLKTYLSEVAGEIVNNLVRKNASANFLLDLLSKIHPGSSLYEAADDLTRRGLVKAIRWGWPFGTTKQKVKVKPFKQ